MNDNLEALAARLAVSDFLFKLGLLENIGNLVADSPGLQEAAVRQRGIVRRRRCQMPLLVGCIESVAVSAKQD